MSFNTIKLPVLKLVHTECDGNIVSVGWQVKLCERVSSNLVSVVLQTCVFPGFLCNRRRSHQAEIEQPSAVAATRVRAAATNDYVRKDEIISADDDEVFAKDGGYDDGTSKKNEERYEDLKLETEHVYQAIEEVPDSSTSAPSPPPRYSVATEQLESLNSDEKSSSQIADNQI